MGYLANLSNSYCPRMRAVVAYAKANGITLPQKTYLKALNTFLKDGKSIIDKLDLLFTFDGSVSAAFRMINLVNPGKYNGVASGGVTYTNNGIAGTGVNAYINTGFNPSLLAVGQKFQLNNACRGILVFQESSDVFDFSKCVLDGSTASLENTLFGGPQGGGQKINCGAGGDTYDLRGTGLKMIVRYNSTEHFIINNSTSVQKTFGSSNLPNGNQLILSRYNAGSGYIYGTAGIAAYFNGASITFDESQKLKVLLNKYRTDRGLAAIA